MDEENNEAFEFSGCKFLRYSDNMTAPRQGIHLGDQKALCYARFDVDGKLQLVQYCKRGRMNYPEAGMTRQCCSDFEKVTHTVSVSISELNSSPRDFIYTASASSEA